MRPLDAGPGGIRRLIRDLDHLLPLWRELKLADANACKYGQENLPQDLLHFDRTIQKIREEPSVSPLSSLAVNGNDLISLGIKEGPQIGHVLRSLHEKVLDDPALNKRESLLELAALEFCSST